MTAVAQLVFAWLLIILLVYNIWQVYKVRKHLRHYRGKQRKYIDMRVYYLTRHDDIGATRDYDSIKWLYDTHLHELDTDEYHYAMLHGANEDSPIKVELWKAEPNWNTPPDKIYNFA